MKAALELFHKQLSFISVLLFKSAVWAQNSSSSHHLLFDTVEQPGLLWGETKWKTLLPRCLIISGKAVDVQSMRNSNGWPTKPPSKGGWLGTWHPLLCATLNFSGNVCTLNFFSRGTKTQELGTISSYIMNSHL